MPAYLKTGSPIHTAQSTGKGGKLMKDSHRVKAFSLQVRLAQLRLKHQDVKAKIATELKRPAPCSLILRGLKLRRLQIKDEMVRCLALLRHHGLGRLSPQHRGSGEPA
ncbi:YdcH family protein [Leisingera sp. JC11]|uniref:YdcH family protein n=1 Tax=Leisingera sp. JC11 TaxID=3042469 RepID=UPI003455D48D